MVMARRDTNGIMVTVNDCGLGVATQKHTTILQQFRQLKPGGSTKLDETWGLSLARRLLALHGEQIWAESGKRKSPSFRFKLPDWILILPIPGMLPARE